MGDIQAKRMDEFPVTDPTTSNILLIGNPVTGALRKITIQQLFDIISGLVPVGGTTDQVLAKNSNSDRDLKWMTPAAGGGASPPDTVTSSTGNTDNGTNHTHALDSIITPKTVTYATLTVDAKGRITACNSGTSPTFYVNQLAGQWNSGSTYSYVNYPVSDGPAFYSIHGSVIVCNVATGAVDNLFYILSRNNFSGVKVTTIYYSTPPTMNYKITFRNIAPYWYLAFEPAAGGTFGFNSRYQIIYFQVMQHWA